MIAVTPPRPLTQPTPAIATESEPSVQIALAAGRDADVASELYGRYAAGVRFHLRRRLRGLPIEDSVLSVLLEVSRLLRGHGPLEPGELNAIVLACTRREVERLASIPRIPAPDADALTLLRRTELVNAVINGLTALERDLLFRAYLLNESDRAIAENTGVPEARVRRVRALVRAKLREFSSARPPS